ARELRGAPQWALLAPETSPPTANQTDCQSLAQELHLDFEFASGSLATIFRNTRYQRKLLKG
ncbi:MAG: hypothetical protein ACOX5T_02900, partial [Candidatus Cryptobacteroides sp.]